MIDYPALIEKGKSLGLTHAVPLDCSTIRLMKEVRDMCADNKCGKYGACWSCPPGCGTLEECTAEIRRFRQGLLVQTVGQLEDSMDFEGMEETSRRHQENFLAFAEYLSGPYPNRLPLGSGHCSRCKTCTYPQAPCRFPEKRISSMEAYGILVTQVCQANDLPYYHGPNTLAYTSCILLE